MKQLIFLSALLLIPFLMNAQTGNTTALASTESYGLLAGTQGANCSFFGYQAGRYSNGNSNSIVGVNAGQYNQEGLGNTYMGVNAGRGILSLEAGEYGEHNTFIGLQSGYSIKHGDRNICIGVQSGRNNQDGSNNVFIGYRAGFNETRSNKLYIENSSDNSPLIYGDFNDDYVVINGGASTFSLLQDPSDYALYVTKGILAEKVKVATKGTIDWSDYVFKEDYDLNSTEEVETFIKKNKHLPNVPSAKEVNENGVDMVEMDATLLRQIEELWLHVIDLKKENDTLKEEVKTLSNK